MDQNHDTPTALLLGDRSTPGQKAVVATIHAALPHSTVVLALLGFTSEARWLRHAHLHLRHLFRYLPQQPGYNKRLRALAPTIEWLITILACDTSLCTDDVWVVDSRLRALLTAARVSRNAAASSAR